MVKIFTVGRDLDADKAFALHNACFGDEREWFDAFLDAAKGQQYLAFGDYLGGAFLLDVTFGEHLGKYVYALGVRAQHRGCGIARELLEKAKAVSKDFTLICAADEGLAATYEKCGFDRYVGGMVLAGGSAADIDTAEFDTPCWYNEAVKQKGFFLSQSLFEFSLAECSAALYTDGKSVVAKAKDGVYAAYGSAPIVKKKAQVYLKKDIDILGALADLILEI